MTAGTSAAMIPASSSVNPSMIVAATSAGFSPLARSHTATGFMPRAKSVAIATASTTTHSRASTHTLATNTRPTPTRRQLVAPRRSMTGLMRVRPAAGARRVAGTGHTSVLVGPPAVTRGGGWG